MAENLDSTLEDLRRYIDTNRLGRHVALRLEGPYIRITLMAEGRDLWLGRRDFVSGHRYFLITDPAEEPRAYFELNESTFSNLLSLPPGLGTQPEGQGESHFLFVSYSREDELLIAPVVDLLRLTDTRVFRDRDSIRPGDEWRTAIRNAIHQSTECLIFWCEHSAASTEVRREIDLALQLRKRMVPVLLDDFPLNGGLQDYQAIDMRGFQPHSPAARPPETPRGQTRGSGTDPVAPTVSPNFLEAATYLENRLADLLHVESLNLIGQPDTPLPPAGKK
jgi:hypothetical protein